LMIAAGPALTWTSKVPCKSNWSVFKLGVGALVSFFNAVTFFENSEIAFSAGVSSTSSRLMTRRRFLRKGNEASLVKMVRRMYCYWEGGRVVMRRPYV
jgi:hypothetical protein